MSYSDISVVMCLSVTWLYIHTHLVDGLVCASESLLIVVQRRRIREVSVSQVKPSYCFRLDLHPTSMISKHSKIPVHDTLYAPRQLVLYLPFLTQEFHP